jgi:hypothetical protein
LQTFEILAFVAALPTCQFILLNPAQFDEVSGPCRGPFSGKCLFLIAISSRAQQATTTAAISARFLSALWLMRELFFQEKTIYPQGG